MNKPTSISYSGLNRWTDCPQSWKAQYIDKIRGPVGEAARRGNDFDELVAHRLGLTVYERDGTTVKPVPTETEELTRMLNAYAEHPESWLRTKPEQKPHTQTKISCSPEQWSELAGKWGSSSKIHFPFNGFIDLGRKMDDGIRDEVLDLKTSSRAEFKVTWPMQVITYAAILGASKASIHLIVPQVKEVKVITKEFLLGANKSIVRNCLNWVAFYQAEINRAVESEQFNELPRLPGYHCSYCAIRDDCKVAGQ
jgi:CRISPR/Cas system-associated exonuclease Cas4 (RecB family)